MEKTDKRLKNLRPWKKGESGGGISPGRPRRRAFIEFVQQMYEGNPNDANLKRLLKQMERKCPQELAHYLAGKPKETISVEGRVEVAQVGAEVLARAREHAGQS